MGIFDSLTDAFTGRPAKEAAAANTERLRATQINGDTELNNGKIGSLGALTTAGGMYAPLAQKYGAGTGLYLDSLGVNGPEGNTRATGAFQAGPGYQYAVDQSLDGINRHAAAAGVAAGGNTLAALGDRAGHMADQEYGSWQDKLGGLVSPEFQATAGMAGAEAAKAPVYQHTADSIVGLDSGVTNGINDQNTQAANAQMAGSKNLWGGILGGATAIASGGTSLLGGIKGLNLGQLGMGGGSPTGYGGKFNLAGLG